MGMYDWVLVNCPKCGEPHDFQSKSGKCLLAKYDLQTCPQDVLLDVNRHAPFNCEKCNTSFYVDTVSRKVTVVGWAARAGQDAQEKAVVDLYLVIDDVLSCNVMTLPEWLRKKLLGAKTKALDAFPHTRDRVS